MSRSFFIDHLRIIDALEIKDPDRAYKAMEDHLESVERILLG